MRSQEKAVPTLPITALPAADALASVSIPSLDHSASRLDFIDGLRGLAMLMVLLYHCWLYGGQWHITVPGYLHPFNLASVLDYGHIGVNLFLVLSGFCLYWPFTRTGRSEPTLWAFARKRCRRILPPYYMSLLFFWAFLLLDVVTHHHYHEDATSVPHVVLSLGWHLLMLHNLRPEYVLSINGVFWSLGLEFSLYILFPILVEGFRRFGPWLTAGAVVVVDLVWRYAAAEVVTPLTPPEDGFVLTNSLPGRCAEFAAGMVAAWVFARLRQDWTNEKSRSVGVICLVACVVCGVAGVWVTELFGTSSTFPDVLWGFCFAFLVVAAIRPESVVHRFLSAPVFVRLGVFSYSVYLVHLPLLKVMDAAVNGRHLSNAAEIAFQVLLAAPLMLLIGYGFHRLFERPFMTSPRPSRAA